MGKDSGNTQEVLRCLEYVLAESYAIYLKTQNYHWNVRGAHFYSYHKLFEEQYQEFAQAIDEIAERIRALGALVPAGFREFLELSMVGPADSKLDAQAMVKDLRDSHALLLQTIQNALEKAEEIGDSGSVDLLTRRQLEHQKAIWFLTSSLEG